MRRLKCSPRFRVRQTALAVSMMSLSVAAQAVEIDVGNTDLTVRFDEAVRYTGAWRAKSVDAATAINTGNALGESRFPNAGDMVVNRLDWLGELDVVYKGDTGFRLAGAAWHDQAQSDCTIKNSVSPLQPTNSYFSSGSYCSSGYWKRSNYQGGELTDAFLFTGFDLGSTRTNVRAGRHTVYWGEAFLSADNGINYNNGPIDGAKAAINPGIEVKEIYMPWEQLSFATQLSEHATVAGFYNLKWRPQRNPEAGSWFQFTDFLFKGADRAPFGAPRLGDVEPAHEGGSWGLSLRTSPEWVDGTLGVYYREYDATSPALGFVNAGTPSPLGLFQWYPDKQKLWGISLNKVIASMSVGFELSHRENQALRNNNMFYVTDSSGRPDGPRGSTWHALVNTMTSLPGTPLWDTGVAIVELSYQRLDKVTRNPGIFQGYGYGDAPGAVYTACSNVSESDAIKRGCATKNYFNLAASVTPQWLSVYRGINLSLPMYISYGLKGNEAAGGADPQHHRYNYSIGLEGQWLTGPTPITARLQYAANAQGDMRTPTSPSNGVPMYTDRSWWSFTLKTSF